MPRPHSLLLSLGAALCAAACQSVGPPGVMVDSVPPGARVSLDGKPTGFVTPCYIAWKEPGQLDVELAGYQPARILLEEGEHDDLVTWGEGEVTPETWTFPLLLPAGDFFLPIITDDSPSPKRIFVKLQLSTDQG